MLKNTVMMFCFLRNNGCVAVGFFLLWFLVNLLRITLPLALAMAALALLIFSFYEASFLALRKQFRLAIPFSLLSALGWTIATKFVSISILTGMVGLPFH